jgi:hypothetical protein
MSRCRFASRTLMLLFRRNSQHNVSRDFAASSELASQSHVGPASAEGRRNMEESMLKSTKYILAAALLAGSSTLVLAQAPSASDANAPATLKQQPGESKTAPASGTNAPAPGGAKQVQNPTAPAAQGTQTGTAADPAGPGADRNAKGSGNPQGPAGMTQRPTGMPTNPSNAGSETGTAPDPAGPGAERKQ